MTQVAGLSTDALTAYAAAVDAGDSVLVRPVTAFDGLDVVVGHVARLSSRPLLVTDLRGTSQRFEVSEKGGDPRAPEDRRIDEPLLAFHTSGSTGRPKCVVYRRSIVNAHARAIAARLELGHDCAYVALPPPGYAYGLSIVHSHHVSGVPVRFVDAQWGLTELDALGDVPLAIYALPQHAPLLLSSGLAASAVRHVIVAGGRLSGSAAQSLADRFPGAQLTNMYGQAELGPRLTTWRGPMRDFAEGTIGRPMPGVDVRIVEGEIHARTPHSMYRYITAPYDEVRPGPRGEFVATRDRGELLPDGTLRHHGRADHMLNVAGTKIDAQLVRALIERTFAPLVVRVDARAARVGGDTVPVIQIVPGADAVRSGAVRRVLHAEIGSVAALCDIRIVDRLEVGESGK